MNQCDFGVDPECAGSKHFLNPAGPSLATCASSMGLVFCIPSFAFLVSALLGAVCFFGLLLTSRNLVYRIFNHGNVAACLRLWFTLLGRRYVSEIPKNHCFALYIEGFWLELSRPTDLSRIYYLVETHELFLVTYPDDAPIGIKLISILPFINKFFALLACKLELLTKCSYQFTYGGPLLGLGSSLLQYPHGTRGFRLANKKCPFGHSNFFIPKACQKSSWIAQLILSSDSCNW